MTLLGLIASTLLCATAYDETFDAGLDAYRRGDFAEAIRRFEDLVEQNAIDSVVFYNLGNAYYRGGQLGPAIANYERALQLDPTLDEARENLLRAVSGTERRLAAPAPPVWQQSLLFWDDGLTRGASLRLAATAWILAWLLLSVRLFRPVRFLRRLAILCFVFTALFAASFWARSHPIPIAVAKAARVPVHYGTNESETVRFELYEGDRVRVDRRENGWTRVVTADGERGWARDALLAFVGPPYERITQPGPDPT